MWKMLKHIAKTHRKRLIGTFSPVGLENLLMLGYPVFGGWAINAVIAGRVWQALLYALVVFLMWLVGAARRIADTRTFTRIYTEIAVPVVLEQRQRQVPHSAVTARVALSREFVSFFEEHLPIAATSVVSIFGACIMLLVLEFWVGVSAVGILALFLWLLPRFAAISENLYFRLNNSLERDNHFIRKGDERQLYRHYGLVSRLQPRSLRLSLRRRGDGYFVRLCFCDDDAQRLRQRGAYLFGRHLSVDVCHEFGRCAAIGRTIFQFERHRTTDRVVGTEHQSRNLKNAV